MITLRRIKHRGYSCILLLFSFDIELKRHIKTFPGMTYSRTHQGFYVVENSEAVLPALLAHCRDLGYAIDNQTAPSKTSSPTAWSIEKEEALQHYKSYLTGLRLSERTIQVYANFVKTFLVHIADVPLKHIGVDEVRMYIEMIVPKRRYSISTHRQLVSAIKHLGTLLRKDALTDLNHFRPRKSSYLPTVLSQREVIALLQVTRNLKHRATLALLYSAGLRIGEVISLELRDLDVDRRQIFIKNGKGRKDRLVIMAESFVPLFRNYLMSYRPQKYFIENPKGGVYTAGSIRNFLRRSCQAAGITKRVTPHTLRHSYATHLIEKGVGLRYVQELLGHSKPETTMIYTHVAKKDLLAIQSPLDAALMELQPSDNKQLKSAFTDRIGG